MVLIYLNIANGLTPDISSLFTGFGENFSKIWLTYFLMRLYSLLWGFLLIIPGIIKALSYSMAPYILAENPHLSAKEALRESQILTDGCKMDLFILSLSFIGWHLLCSITFGIAYIYVFPYIRTTYANVYYELKNNKESYIQCNL